MSFADETNREVDIDLGRIFASVWHHKGKILLAALTVTAIAFVILQGIKPRYDAETRILIRPTDPVLSSPSGDAQTRASEVDDQGIAGQVQLLRSRSIAEAVAEKLELRRVQEFGGTATGSLFNNIFVALGLTDAPKPVPINQRVIDAYFERLSVRKAEGARVIVISFWSTDGEMAAKVPNAVAAEFLALQEKLKRGADPEELKKLEPELRDLRASVVEAEEAIADFRAQSNLLQSNTNASLAQQELSELATELGRVRRQLSTAKANATAVRNALRSGSLDTANSVLSSPLIQRLRERQIALQGQLSDLATTLLDGHPRIQSVQRQLSALNQQIKAEARKIETSLQQQVAVARNQEDDLLTRREELAAEAQRVDKAGVQLRALEREAAARRELLTQSLARFKRAQAKQNSGFLPSDGFIFSRAEPQSTPFFPRKLPTLIGAFFGTLMLGAVLCLTLSVLSGQAVKTVGTRNAARSEPSVAGIAASTETQATASVSVGGNADSIAPTQRAGLLQRVLKRGGDASPPPGQTAPAPSFTPSVEAQDMPTPGQRPAAPEIATAIPVAHAPSIMPSQDDLAMRAQPSQPHVDTGVHDTDPPVEDDFDLVMPALSDITTNMGTASRSLLKMNRARVVVVTPDAQEGSHGTVNLARSLANNGRSVIVLDLTGRGTATHRMLVNHQVPGVKDVMAGTHTFSTCMHRDDRSTAHIMPTGRASVRQAAANKTRLTAVIQVLEQAYDYTIIDCGPSDAAGIARVASPDSFNIVMSSLNRPDFAEAACRLFAAEGFGVPLVVRELTPVQRGTSAVSA